MNHRLMVRRVGSAMRSSRDLSEKSWRKLTPAPIIIPALHSPQTFVTRRAMRPSAAASPARVRSASHATPAVLHEPAREECSRVVSCTSSRKQTCRAADVGVDVWDDGCVGGAEGDRT